MAFFKHGDTVSVRRDLIPGNTYFCEGEEETIGCNATTAMSEMAGRQVTISEVLLFEFGVTRYYLNEDPYNFFWADEMFEEYLHRNDPEPDVELQTSEEFLSFLLS